MSFLNHFYEDTRYSSTAGALATTVSNELQPDYTKPPKEIVNPFQAVLVAHIKKPVNMDNIVKAAEVIKKDYKTIDLDKLDQILSSFNLELQSNHTNALYNLYNNLGKIVTKYS